MIVILPEVRLSYPDIYTPGEDKTDNEGKLIKGKFGAHGIFAPTSEANRIAKTAFIAVAKEKWKDNYQNVLASLGKDKKCIRQGNHNLTRDGAIRDGYKDLIFISARNKARPAVVAHKFFNKKPVIVAEDGSAWQDGHRIDDLPFEVIAPYGGCYVNLKVDIYAMDKDKLGKSINATLLAVQYVRRGDAFGAVAGTAEGFEEAEGDGDSGGGQDGGAEDDLFGDAPPKAKAKTGFEDFDDDIPF
jgi:hypothetical protein